MEKLAKKKKPLTDKKWSEIIDNRIGMDFNYQWDLINKEFRRFYSADFALSDNTIIIFFKNSRTALRLGNSEFQGDDPMFPPTLLKNVIQIRYRCSLTQQIRYGAKIIETDLPLEAFNISDGNDNYISLLKALRRE
jgi:hypothetical protein